MSHDPIAYSIEQVPALIGLPRTTVYEAVRRGDLRTAKVGKRRLIRRTVLERWLEALERAGQPGRHGEQEATGT
jgi:excisionase family DNA binding protein